MKVFKIDSKEGEKMNYNELKKAIEPHKDQVFKIDSKEGENPMNYNELKKAIEPHKDQIFEIAKKHGTPLKKEQIFVSKCLPKEHRDKSGKIILILSDKEPGWRAKDDKPKRSALKREIQSYLNQKSLYLAVQIIAKYSKLQKTKNGNIQGIQPL